ncbi:MAG: hypothetical protein VX776_05205, partial [Planctomycetota bacterium]|nr:hypothetical protein [Planctomycetota bacterium]
MQASSDTSTTQTEPSEPVGEPGVRKNLLRARWMIVLAAVLWSTNGFFAKAPWFDGWPGFVLAFWRAMFACAILLP